MNRFEKNEINRIIFTRLSDWEPWERCVSSAE